MLLSSRDEERNMDENEQRLIDSWNTNATPWTRAIRNQQNETFHPAPWYFRTVESWIEGFHARNYRLLKLREPCHPATNKPISIIFVFERQ